MLSQNILDLFIVIGYYDHMPTDNSKLITDYRLLCPITEYRLLITDYCLPITEYRLLITDYRILPTAYCSLLLLTD